MSFPSRLSAEVPLLVLAIEGRAERHRWYAELASEGFRVFAVSNPHDARIVCERAGKVDLLIAEERMRDELQSLSDVRVLWLPVSPGTSELLPSVRNALRQPVEFRPAAPVAAFRRRTTGVVR
jgi:hypothetical protein